MASLPCFCVLQRRLLKPKQALTGLFRLMICPAAVNAIPLCIVIKAGGAAASWSTLVVVAVRVAVRVTVPIRVTPVLLHDAVGSVLRCLTPSRFSLKDLWRRNPLWSPLVFWHCVLSRVAARLALRSMHKKT